MQAAMVLKAAGAKRTGSYSLGYLMLDYAEWLEICAGGEIDGCPARYDAQTDEIEILDDCDRVQTWTATPAAKALLTRKEA